MIGDKSKSYDFDYRQNKTNGIKRNNKNKRRSVGFHQKPMTEYNGLLYMHGMGCRDWDNCFTCPKKKCTWT